MFSMRASSLFNEGMILSREFWSFDLRKGPAKYGHQAAAWMAESNIGESHQTRPLWHDDPLARIQMFMQAKQERETVMISNTTILYIITLMIFANGEEKSKCPKDYHKSPS